MKNIVRNLTLLGCVSSSAIAAPFLAIGDNAELFLTATASASYNDNVLLSPSGGELEDEVFVFRPGFDLQFGKNSQIKGNVYGSGTFSAYSDNSNLNNQLGAIGFVSKYDNGQLQLGANASFTQLDQPTVDTPTTSTLVERDITAGGLDSELSLSQKTSIGAGVSYTKTDYKTAGYVGQEEYSVPVNFYYELTPKIDLSVGVRYTNTQLDDALDTEYNAFYYNIGARGSFTPKLVGSFSIGYNTRDANVGPDEDGSFGANASLTYLYSDKTQFTFAASRDFANAAVGAAYENTQVSFGASTDIAIDWKLNASLTYRRLDYQVGNRADDYIEASIGATYVINSNLSASAGYTFRDNSSNAGSGAEFNNNVFSVSLSARY